MSNNYYLQFYKYFLKSLRATMKEKNRLYVKININLFYFISTSALLKQVTKLFDFMWAPIVGGFCLSRPNFTLPLNLAASEGEQHQVVINSICLEKFWRYPPETRSTVTPTGVFGCSLPSPAALYAYPLSTSYSLYFN